MPDGVRTTDRESHAPTGKLFFAPGGRTGASAKLKSSPRPTRQRDTEKKRADRGRLPARDSNLACLFPQISQPFLSFAFQSSLPTTIDSLLPSQVTAADSLAGHRRLLPRRSPPPEILSPATRALHGKVVPPPPQKRCKPITLGPSTALDDLCSADRQRCRLDSSVRRCSNGSCSSVGGQIYSSSGEGGRIHGAVSCAPHHAFALTSMAVEGTHRRPRH